MSKTKGNTIDPLVINEKYGTDAVRFALLISAAPGGDIALSEDRIESCRNFANKIWNASRLLFSKPRGGAGEPVSLADRWIASRLNACAEVTNRAFEGHRYHEAAQALWHFFWDEFCDAYLEFKKLDTDWSYAYKIYKIALRLLHPLMPFLTEELWQRLELPGRSIALTAYPTSPELRDAAVEETMYPILRVVDEIRAYRAMSKLDPKAKIDVTVRVGDNLRPAVREGLAAIEALTRTNLSVPDDVPRVAPYEILFPEALSQAQRDRLLKENAELEKVIANSDRQLSNGEIISKMPEKVVETLRTKNAAYKAQLQKNLDALASE